MAWLSSALAIFPKFDWQHPHGTSQPYVPPVPGIQSSPGKCRYRACARGTDIHTAKHVKINVLGDMMTYVESKA